MNWIWGIMFIRPFLKCLDVELLAGNKEDLVKDIYNIVLTETAAKSLFELKDDDYGTVVGELIKIDRFDEPYKVTGVVADAPSNSHLPYEMFLSRETLFTFWRSAEFDWTGFRSLSLPAAGARYRPYPVRG